MELNTHPRSPVCVPRILLGVSPIGLGHATRALVLAEELERNGAQVRLFSGGKAAEFIRDTGRHVDGIVDDPVPRVVNGEMSQVALWYLRSWRANRRTVPRTRRLAESFRPDIIVCDEEFSGITVAEERGLRGVFISDELELGFARTWVARKLEGRVEKWYRSLQKRVDLLIVPEPGRDSGNKIFVGPIVRPPTKSPEEVRRSYLLPEGKMVLFAMSGSGIGRNFAVRLRDAVGASGLSDTSVVVTGNRGRKITGKGVYDLGVVGDNQNLVAAADVVVSTAGKSTIDEAAAAGTPIIVVPIRYHAEQERNAAALGYSSEDAERFAELVREKLGRRETPRSFNGEVKASRAILALLKKD